jgi:hypothetical protein
MPDSFLIGLKGLFIDQKERLKNDINECSKLGINKI